MKTAADVSDAKLRGGFYTPPRLVDHTLARLRGLVPDRPLRVLEPGVGDGAFIDGLARQRVPLERLVALDVDERAVVASRERLGVHELEGVIIARSMLSWSLSTSEKFDAVVGNLPFVRFQFVPPADRVAADRHAELLGVQIGGVANLWLPMLVASLSRLTYGGAFSLILPAECFTGVTAGSARKWLLQNTTDLRCDLYPPGSFPEVLQEVVVLSGRVTPRPPDDLHRIIVALHGSQYSADGFSDSNAILTDHTVRADGEAWTKLLLTRPQLEAYHEAQKLPATTRLGSVARFEVAAVTGANSFFSLRHSEVVRHDLGEWVRPLLARSNQAPGLHFTNDDYETNVRDDRVAYLFDSNLNELDRAVSRGADGYLRIGEQLDLHKRYKCRIREPWYAIPYIKHSSLMLSKRSHFYPRAILNDTSAVTTDTIYRGRLLDDKLDASDFVAGFHNSLTLLSAELEGRSFGGGVLELVPSEVGRLTLVKSAGIGEELPRLDKLVREATDEEAGDSLVWETDLLLQKRAGIPSELLDLLREGWHGLQHRRLVRAGRLSS